MFGARRVFDRVDRIATPRRLIILLVLEVLVLGGENLLDFPLSVPFMQRVAGHPYLDMCAFCSAGQIDAQLDDFGDAGRRLQLLLMPTIDLLIPVLSCAFGSIALAVLLPRERWQWLRWLPLIAMGLDFAENAAIVALVTAYPARLDVLASVSGLLTGLKFVAYLATAAAVAVGAVARLREHLVTGGARAG
jgi:hypothetical protein